MSTEPVQSGEAATDDDKVAGVIEQTRGDVSQGNVDDIEDVLRQRFADAGLELSADEFARALAAVRKS